MYTFLDNGKRSLTLRPEGTAGIMRSIVENKLYASPELPLKIYYRVIMAQCQYENYRWTKNKGIET
jgi:histidyl-tRNA synthetase